VLDLGRPLASWFSRAYLAIDGTVEATVGGRREQVVPAREHLIEVWHRKITGAISGVTAGGR
jgi:hypothetical protein